MSVGFPLVLQSNITGFTAAGTVRTLNDPLVFQAPGKGALLVEALSFAFDQFAPHEVMIMCGRAKLTNGYVPITSILTPQEARKWTSNGWAAAPPPPDNAAATWRFDVPMYVPVGTRLSFMWRAAPLNPAVGANPVRLVTKVEVAAKCRQLPVNYPEPKVVAVPWATVFNPPGTTEVADDTVAALFRSVIGDVSNNFRSALRVRHFIGASVTPEAGMMDNDGPRGGAGPQQDMTQRRIAQIQIRDWLGNNIVRDPTLLAHLCQAIRREWKVDFALPPTRSLFVTMDERHAAVGGALATAINVIRSSLALIGWRQETIEEVRS